ncbi:MAG: IS630 family transposase [Gammaproteobacteria bacterium]|nr:IS630 family transposase [Gammaproteobacteria bacterium]
MAYGWILRGTRKNIATTARQIRLNFIGAVSLEGHTIIHTEVERVNAQTIKSFLKSLRKRHTPEKEIHVIWDNAAYHKSKDVQSYAKDSNIKLHYLPSYSPNLNPIERLWKMMHEAVTTSAKNYPTQINKMCYSDAMKKTDGRSLPHSAREAIRRHAVAQVLSGESPEKVIKALGFHRSCIDDWLSRYEQGGEQALSTGKITGRPRKCPDEYADRLRELVKTNPLQLDFHDALWTRSMIQILLKDKFGIEVSERSVGNILSRLGMSAQRPGFKAYEQNPDQVKVWLRETWPEVQREAKRRRARVYFGDESTIRSDYHRGTTWGVRGDTPVVAKTGRRFSVNMLSAVSPKGHLRFMVTESRVTADVFIDFLRRLLHNAKRSVYLIVDGHPIHRAKKVQEFVRNSQGKLTLVWLPPYSPELNPDELVWHHVKSQRIGRTVVATKEQLMALARSVLHSLQQNTQIIKRFFYEKHVRYILN